MKDTFLLSNIEAQVQLNFAAPNASALGYTSYLLLNYERTLSVQDLPVLFFKKQAGSFTMSAGAPPEVWRIGTFNKPVKLEVGTENNTFVTADTATNAIYVAFMPQQLPEATVIGKVAPQNLLASPAPELLIVTHPNFRAAAERLARFRQQHDQLQTLVVSTEDIYTEVSGGRQDISAIRNFARYLYNKNPEQLKYLLLIGDASYDYLNRTTNNTNFVPTYESRQSLHPIYSFSSDDYFGFMEADEGEWAEDGCASCENGNHTLDIGVGRLPVTTAEEAEAVVDKLMAYSADAARFAPWKTRIAFVADDGDRNIHQLDADLLAEKLKEMQPFYSVEKLYVDAYPQTTTPNGKRSPIVKQKLSELVEEGSFIINYNGHGAETGWTNERILDNPQVINWINPVQLPLLLTATCEFGRFDDPRKTSGAEYAILNPNGGAIALLTTTRPVFSNTNFMLNEAFYASAFAPLPNGEMPRLGDILRYTKNNSMLGVVNRNFSLLGDPSLRLNYPQRHAEVTRISNRNGEVLTQLKAQEEVNVEGAVFTANGAVDASFNGTAQIAVYDKPATAYTLGDEDSPMAYKEQRHLLFKGSAQVNSGKYSTRFVVPKDIDYGAGAGRIQVYAVNNEATADAGGAFTELNISGTAADAPADVTPPEIQLFLQNEGFTQGATVADKSLLYANFTDASGISISNRRPGFGIELFIDGAEMPIANLSNYYLADTDNYTSGRLSFRLPSLPDGPHTLKLTARDTYNNLGSKSLQFTVNSDMPLLFNDVQVYPNPVAEEDIWLNYTHDQLKESYAFTIELHDIQGRKVAGKQLVVKPTSLQTQAKLFSATELAGLPAGIYVMHIDALATSARNSTHFERKMILLR